ncbi:abnormal pharyngeal pumping eat-20 [Loa loa]|uniref:Abnormal pharyngeal pumping eat-20 n=1 Tax=Loa loa TaxID=7209 RepID=A0A1S0UFY5_LOALO|nr:abnormal pharyngeal pumping eat-20 [Loa loa]EJD74326.1 abnormal pharyngeal pumping eat-20 [Loa loa]
MHTFLSNYFILFLSFLQVFLQNAIVIAFDESAEITTAHFGDPKRGRMSWIIDENTLPWIGQYYYIESPQSPFTNLLSVVDSSNGNHLGNCASYAPRDNKWRRFFWTLTTESLICNITDSEATISKIHFPSISSPRTFSIRILAQQGPKCFRDMIVQNEKLEGCPPKLQRNFFQGMSLECNCSVLTINAHMRSGIAPFHFVNPRITSSDGKLSISRDFSRVIPGNISNLNPIKTATEIIPGITITATTSTITTVITTTTAAIITTTATTTTTTESIKMTVTTKEFGRNLPIDIQQNSELISPIIQESFVSAVNHELLSPLSPSSTTSSSSSLSDMIRINEQACMGIQCQNNDGFVGSQCEINLCANVQCMHNGICQVKNNVPHCQCQPGTTGTFCEQLICNPKCEQGGICELKGNVPVCRCPTGTFSINCNIIDTCITNREACLEYGSNARCQLDSDNFALISPVLVNATYKCLCLNEQSEWFDCKELPRRIHVPSVQTNITSTMSIPIPDVVTSAIHQEIPEKSQSTQHIAPIFQNHPHFSNLFPNPFQNLSPFTNTTTITTPSSINPDANFHPSDESGMNISAALNRPIKLFPELQPTVREPELSGIDTVTRIPILTTISPLFITQKSFLQFHHLFSIPPEFPKSEIATTTAVTLSGHPEFDGPVKSTESIAGISLNATDENFDEMSNELKNVNVTIESSFPSSFEEFPAMTSASKMMINNTSIIPLSTFSEFVTTMSPISISTTVIIDGDSNVAQIDSLIPIGSETDGSIFVSKINEIIEESNLSNQLLLSTTTTSLSSTFKIDEEEEIIEDENLDYSQSFTKSTKEMEQVKIFKKKIPN